MKTMVSSVRSVSVNSLCSSAGFVSNVGQGLSYASLRGVCTWNVSWWWGRRMRHCDTALALPCVPLCIQTKVFEHIYTDICYVRCYNHPLTFIALNIQACLYRHPIRKISI